MRPKKLRHLCFCPKVTQFKPRGIPMRNLQEVVLTDDETEVIKLIDYDGLDQEETAKKLKISRITVQRIYKSARAKIAEAMICGKALRLHGSNTGDCGCGYCQNKYFRKVVN